MKHGKTNTPEWNSWHNMIARCTQLFRNDQQFYTLKGITVCERWMGKHGFENFLEDMGERPRGTTLGRKNSDDNYYKDNCEWQDYRTQSPWMGNRRIVATIDGIEVSRTYIEWAEHIGMSYRCFLRRIPKWGAKLAATTPRRRRPVYNSK